VNKTLLKYAIGLSLAVAAAGFALPAAAQHHGGGGHSGGGHPSPGGHGGGHSPPAWHGGDHYGHERWHDGWGWWGLGLGLGLGWDAYYYPYYYPYDYYAPPPVVVEPQVAAPATPSPPATWYYCDSARDYYPRVTQCPEPWRPVPAVPPGATQ
jgi:hypothetical protein